MELSRRKGNAEPRKLPRATDIADVARRIRRFRDAAGLTQEALARRADLTAKFISMIENGRVNPSIEAVARLVEVGLAVPLAAFFAAESGDVRADLDELAALLGSQPAVQRRRAVRVLRALCDE